MEQDLCELPDGWTWEKFGDVVVNHDGKRIPIKASERKTSNRTYPYYGATGIIDYVDDYIFEENHLLISEDGANLVARKYPIAFIASGKYWVNNHAHVVDAIAKKTSNQYLVIFFAWTDLSRYITGAAQPKLSQKKLNSIPVPLPPISEQKRIVAKLDALFTRIDTAITHLQQTLELSKALFASALDSALVPTGNIESPPESWSCETLQAVSNLVSDGTHHSPKEQFQDKQDGLFKYVTSKNIKFDGLKLENITYIRKEVHDEIYARCNPEYLDQLITKDGAMTGTCCLNTLDEPFSLLSSVALVKLKRELMSPHFLNYFLQSPTGQELMIGDISGAAITRTNLKKLKAIKVPLPPIKEQQRIVSHLNSLSERTCTLKASTQEKINDLTALKASLLDAAFKGQL